MKRKFTAVALAATTAVILSGCGGDITDGMSQKQLAEYCGLDRQKILEDLRAQDNRIKDFKIVDTDCNTQVEYIGEDGKTHQASAGNDAFMTMLMAGGMGALAGYMMGNASQRSALNQQYADTERRRRTASSAYVAPNSRAGAAYTSGTSASRIQSVSKSGAVTTRSNPMRGTSSVPRSSSYSGG